MAEPQNLANARSFDSYAGLVGATPGCVSRQSYDCPRTKSEDKYRRVRTAEDGVRGWEYPYVPALAGRALHWHRSTPHGRTGCTGVVDGGVYPGRVHPCPCTYPYTGPYQYDQLRPDKSGPSDVLSLAEPRRSRGEARLRTLAEPARPGSWVLASPLASPRTQLNLDIQWRSPRTSLTLGPLTPMLV